MSVARSAKVRRTLALPSSTTSELARIKETTLARTDTAAIRDAVSFRARLALHDVQEIEHALAVWDELKRAAGGSSSIIIETTAEPKERFRLIVPGLRAAA